MSIYESGDVQSYIYFPTDSIVSLLYVLKNGPPAEIAVIGNEGTIGVSFMGGETTPRQAVGATRALHDRSALQLLLRYTQSLIADGADRRLQPPPLGGSAGSDGMSSRDVHCRSRHLMILEYVRHRTERAMRTALGCPKCYTNFLRPTELN